jgi:hypothetical protein
LLHLQSAFGVFRVHPIFPQFPQLILMALVRPARSRKSLPRGSPDHPHLARELPVPLPTH